jgi:hypothetical protein
VSLSGMSVRRPEPTRGDACATTGNGLGSPNVVLGAEVFLGAEAKETVWRSGTHSCAVERSCARISIGCGRPLKVCLGASASKGAVASVRRVPVSSRLRSLDEAAPTRLASLMPGAASVAAVSR